MDDEPPPHPDELNGAIQKPVMTLAIVPTNRTLTVTGRKISTALMRLAQRQARDGSAEAKQGFSAPLLSILRAAGAADTTSDARQYLKQMMHTTVEWRPLAKTDTQLSLRMDDADETSEAIAPSTGVTEEVREFNLLAEVRLYKKAGMNWVTWFYPQTILDEVIAPSRWANIDFETLRSLKTYCAVALYEICARYRDNPMGVTSRQTWQWWVEALRGSPNSKIREWRKFKNEFVNPAIKEINAADDINIELIEFKRGREVSDVQFRVKRGSGGRPMKAPPAPADITSIYIGRKLGLSEALIEELEGKYGEAAVREAVMRMEAHLATQPPPTIRNRAAYLRGIMSKRAADQASVLHKPAQAPDPDNKDHGGVATPRSASATTPTDAEEASRERARRLTQIRLRFAQLKPDQQRAWAQRAAREISPEQAPSPLTRQRLERGEWQSPLVQIMVLEHFARNQIGSDWASMPAAQFEEATASAS